MFFLNFSQKKRVIPKQGGGAGGPPLGKNSHIFPFFFLGSFPNIIYTKIYPTSLSLDSRSVYIYCRLQDVFDKLVPAWYPSHQIIEKSIF